MILSRSPTVEQQLNYSKSTIYVGCGNGFGCSYEETKMTVGHFFYVTELFLKINSIGTIIFLLYIFFLYDSKYVLTVISMAESIHFNW